MIDNVSIKDRQKVLIERTRLGNVRIVLMIEKDHNCTLFVMKKKIDFDNKR